MQYELIDVTFDPSIKAEMRERCGGDETTAAPQIFSGDRYCGVSGDSDRYCGVSGDSDRYCEW